MKVQNASQDAPASNILLIHHNRPGLAARKCVLEEIGYCVTAVSNPHDGLEQFAKSKFDLVITDFRMPHMNGDELIRELRDLRRSTPVILISGVVDALGLNEENTGADVVIAKSNVEVNHMIRAVNRLLRKKPTASQAGKKTKARSV